MAAVFESFHPAVLRLIDTTIAAGREAGIEVGLCGEMAGDPLATPLLLGLGLQKFSMAALSLPAVKEKVRTWSLDAARSLARQALELSSGEEVQTLVLNWETEPRVRRVKHNPVVAGTANEPPK